MKRSRREFLAGAAAVAVVARGGFAQGSGQDGRMPAEGLIPPL